MRERIITGLTLLGFALFCAFDVGGDLRAGSPWDHVLIEGGLSFIGFGLGLIVLIRYFRIRTQLGLTEEALLLSKTETLRSFDNVQQAREEAQRWKTEASRYIQGLSQAIDAQFDQWKFSPAEREVALFLLKGLSLKEIAGLRGVAERTVRQQTTMLYQKANISGRSELSAFFLEDLLSASAKKNEVTRSL